MSLKSSYFSVLVLIIVGQFVPALKNFHVEATLVVSIVFFVWGIIRGTSSFKKAVGFWIWIGMWLAFFDFSRGCLSQQGFFLWLLHPMMSFVFGSAIHAMADALFPQRKIAFALTLGISVSLIEIVLPLLALPHVYLFGHVFGFWPGPVYDRAVLVDNLHVIARLSTLALSIFLFLWARAILYRKRFPVISLLVFVAAFLISVNCGIYRTHTSVKNELGSISSDKNITLVFDSNTFSNDNGDSLLAIAQRYLDEISEQLNLDFPENRTIEVFVYNHAWQKKKLTGAKFTSYVPVWQQRHRIHITQQALESTLKHEMVHVVAKEFGNWFGASYNAALIEGLAVALAEDSSANYSNTDLVRAWNLHQKIDVESMFSLRGFYAGRGSQSYSAAGSFVAFVLEEEGSDFVKSWYRDGFLANENSHLPTLISQWKSHIDSLSVDSSLIPTSQRIYSRKSPIELDCPHVFTQLETDVDNAFLLTTKGDTTLAKQIVDKYASDSVLYARLNEALFGE